MKKVIFVGGTEFSGSTFFHMILANDKKGLAIGEVNNLMKPPGSYYFNMHCSCGERPGELWEMIKKQGEERVFATLFELFPDIDFIVDSSKNPFWIHDQMRYISKQGITAQNILMWKSPYELASSFRKRGNLDLWKRSWEVYHRVYLTLIEDWRSVAYREFVTDRSKLTEVCDYLELTDFAGKERYWEREQHVLGGNPSALVHLFAEDDQNYQENVKRSTSKIDVNETGTFQSIHYSAEVEPSLKEIVDKQIADSPYIESLLDLLIARDVARSGGELDSPPAELRMQPLLVQSRRFKQAAVRKKARLLHTFKPEPLN